ncbi:hypothetical protein I7I51_03971 [Histoplasma capsulatum]|uniref:Uncharacterized protein n=1 Tax=Ajellomyces capsulatus TaxID=5037 RepID=A0A8A1MB08_AJECA|nr:predicted protein [Histoplasma mississippiense (nom. inval.)]EDN08081.1 predicted protein [Histoplasma mississippiense (nom. inval.)]QSS61794.1 hypothetical protein I7I51_03971 [Histoplasma capsulatum]
MSFLAQDDINIGAEGAEAPKSPSCSFRWQHSDPPRPSSASIQFTPAVNSRSSLKCVWCGELFQSSDEPTTLPAEVLREHIAIAHPEVAKLSLVEQDATDETPPTESVLDEAEQTNRIEAFARQREAAIVERRLDLLWNINAVEKFTDDYDGEEEGLPSFWKTAFGDFERPKPYEQETVAKGKFLPITKAEIYIDILKEPESHTTEELYAITANTALALRVWQDEYVAIDKLSKRATRRSLKKVANPRKLEEPLVFEDKKEAMLYGYKHDPRESKIGYQDPFLQGGFKPTPAQLKRLKLNAAESPNIDGWTPIKINGVEYIPGIRPPSKPAPKKKPVEVDTADTSGISNGVDREVDGRPKRITRFGGFRHPLTRETSQVQTEPSSPVSGPTSAKVKRSKSRATSTTPQPPSQPISLKPSTPTTRPIPPVRSLTVKLATSGAPAITTRPVTPTATATVPSKPPVTGERAPTPLYEDPLLDPKNQLKIQQSKNPKRTEAMIIHWAKFNHEGRTRNPKRTKAQMEADKAEAEKQGGVKAGPGRKRRSISKSRGADNQDTPVKKAKRIAKGTRIPVTHEKVEPPEPYHIVPPQSELRRPEHLINPLSAPTHPQARYSPYGGQVYQINYHQGNHQ